MCRVYGIVKIKVSCIWDCQDQSIVYMGLSRSKYRVYDGIVKIKVFAKKNSLDYDLRSMCPICSLEQRNLGVKKSLKTQNRKP